MTEETAKGLLDFLLPQVKQESATTRKVLAAVPEQRLDYKPSEKCMSGLDLAIHIAASEAFFLNGVLNGAFDWKQPDLKAAADIVAWYDQTVPPLIEKLASLPAAKLAQDVNFMGFMNQPAVTFLSLNLLHNSHHRGQLSSYLRPMGGKVPSIYGPSADEPLQATAGD